MPLWDLVKFTQVVFIAKPTIESFMLDSTEAPALLPENIRYIISAALGLDYTTVNHYWALIKDEIWVADAWAGGVSPDLARLYNQYALPQGTSYRHLYPPTRVCTNKDCPSYRLANKRRTLTSPRTYKATLFTLREGALPIYTTSFYCRSPGCNRRYHHNYVVHDQSNTRAYYSRMPDVVQVAEHCFMESSLLEFFASGMVFGWLSSMNCARIYNASIGRADAHIQSNSKVYPLKASLNEGNTSWQSSLFLSDAHVLNGFFLYSVLLDKAERQSALIVNHNEPSQRERLRDALEERNKRMEGIGQERYTHACDLCFVVFENAGGQKMKIQAAVCDGNTIGHPCCAVHDCKLPLAGHKQRYCVVHQRELGDQCAVDACMTLKEDGYRTCIDQEHRALETAYFEKGKALFQLQNRLRKAGVTVPTDSTGISVANELEDDIMIETCDGKPEAGNRKLKAYFGRRRSHNEQLIMRPCGVILARATFFGSEAVSSVNDFAKKVFPTPESTPEYFIFDNNCKLDAHQRTIGDEHFKNTAKPVDVFHFKSKHKEMDTHCQQFCNPAAFKELTKGGKWLFNTSICEQTNVWIGGYQAILRDMEATRFNFYLDEMIKRRNRFIESELFSKGHFPWSVSVDALFHSN